MSLTRTSVQSTATGIYSQPYCTARPFSRLRHAQRKHILWQKCQVLRLDAVEAQQESVSVDDDRQSMEITYARSKATDLLQLTQTAELLFSDLMKAYKTRRSKSNKRRQIVPEPKVTIPTKLDWNEKRMESEDDIYVETTRKKELLLRNRIRNTVSIAEPPTMNPSPMIMRLGTANSCLLTADEEKELGYHIQKMMSIEQVRKDFKRIHKRMPKWHELGKILNRDINQLKADYNSGLDARESMISRNIRLVISVAAKHRPEGLDLDDAITAGVLGLARAVEKFDPERGCKLSTYAHWWIRQSIMRTYIATNRVIAVPGNVYTEFQRIQDNHEKYAKEHGVEPTDTQLAEVLGLTQKRFRVVSQAYNEILSLDKELGDEESETHADAIADTTTPSPDEFCMRSMMTSDLELVLSTLPEKEATVLRLRYGLDDGCERTLEDVGNLFHVSRERVRQIEGKALRRLRQRRGSLKGHLDAFESFLPRCTAGADLRPK